MTLNGWQIVEGVTQERFQSVVVGSKTVISHPFHYLHPWHSTLTRKETYRPSPLRKHNQSQKNDSGMGWWCLHNAVLAPNP